MASQEGRWYYRSRLFQNGNLNIHHVSKTKQLTDILLDNYLLPIFCLKRESEFAANFYFKSSLRKNIIDYKCLCSLPLPLPLAWKFCHFILVRFNKQRKFRRLRNIMIGDDTWGYYWDPRKKRLSMEWMREDQQRPVKIRRRRSVCEIVSKCKLFHQWDIVWQLFILYEWMLEEFMRKLRKKVQRATDSFILHYHNASSHSASLTRDFLRRSGSRSSLKPFILRTSPCDFLCFRNWRTKDFFHSEITWLSF